MKGWLRLQTRLEEAVLTYGTLAIAALMVANVLTRTLFGFSLTFGEELSQFLIVLICFVGLSYAASQRRHIRMSAFTEQLDPARRRWVETVVAATTSLLLLLLTALAIRYVWVVADLGSVSPVLGVPLFVVYLIAPVGFFLSALQYAGQAVVIVRGGTPFSLDPSVRSEPADGDETAEESAS